MRTHMRMLAAVAGTALVAGALLGGSASAAAKKGPVVVGTDAANDWGSNVHAQLAPIGNLLGQELVEAAIEKVDATTLNFIIKVNSLPPTGGVPEITRYVWTMTVDGTLLQLDGKFTNYSRGACDPTSGQCPPPRDPGLQPFILRGECRVEPTPVTNLTICEELAKLQGVFDAAEATITIPVPVDALGAKPGSKIAGIPGTFGGTISAAPAAFVTSSNFPMDQLFTTKTFVLPKK